MKVSLLLVQPCDHQTSRNRTRRVLRLPASPQDSPCPDLVQSEPCILNSTCFTHYYSVSGRVVCTAGYHWPPRALTLTVDYVQCGMCLYFRLEHLPAEWECGVWGRLPPASPRLHSQRWKGCGVAEVWAGNTCKDHENAGLFTFTELETWKLVLTALATPACSLRSQHCWLSCSWVWSTSGRCQRAAWWTVLSAAYSQIGHRGQGARARVAARVSNQNLRPGDYTNGHTTHQLISCASLFQMEDSLSCWVVHEYIRMH